MPISYQPFSNGYMEGVDDCFTEICISDSDKLFWMVAAREAIKELRRLDPDNDLAERLEWWLQQE